MLALLFLATAAGKSFRAPFGPNNGASIAFKMIAASTVPKFSHKKSEHNDRTAPNFFKFGGKRSSNSPKREAIRVVTDIDDTVVSSGGLRLFGIHLGGVDNRYKRGQFYPGAINFALELSKNMGNVSGELANIPSRVAVLTARAKEFKFALALKPTGKLCKAYHHIGKKHGEENWGIGDVYYGSVAEWILQGRKGLRKYKNFEILMKEDKVRDGEDLLRKYIIIGDTGEKDEDAAERAAAQYPDRLRAVFMHQVFDIKKKDKHILREDRRVNGVPFYYFRTYVGAGIKAYRNNLINKESLKRITSHAVDDLKVLDKQLAQNVARNPFSKFRRLRLMELQKLRWDEVRADANECAFLNPLLDE